MNGNKRNRLVKEAKFSNTTSRNTHNCCYPFLTHLA